MSLWSLCQAVLLVTNGLAVLNEGRFLSKCEDSGWKARVLECIEDGERNHRLFPCNENQEASSKISRLTERFRIESQSVRDPTDGLGRDRLGAGDFGGRTTLRGQVAGLLHAVSYLRWPLIFINVIVIVVKVIFG